MEPAFSLKHKVGKQKRKSSLGESSFPSTAYDYLQYVQDEASKCPDVVVADIDCSSFHRNQEASFIASDSLCSSVDTKHVNKPAEEWQKEQTAAFSEIRQFLVQHKALLKNQKERIQKISLPPAEDELQWFSFCFGSQESKGTSVVQGNDSNIPVKQVGQGTPALLSIICKMNQPTVLCVLDHHITWLETTQFTLLQGQWIYSLLAAVEKPLLADTTYSLRCLARLCSRQKETLTTAQNAETAALHLLITLVTRYFGQSDLETPS